VGVQGNPDDERRLHDIEALQNSQDESVEKPPSCENTASQNFACF